MKVFIGESMPYYSNYNKKTLKQTEKEPIQLEYTGWMANCPYDLKTANIIWGTPLLRLIE